jgi:hypothetical protein
MGLARCMILKGIPAIGLPLVFLIGTIVPNPAAAIETVLVLRVDQLTDRSRQMPFDVGPGRYQHARVLRDACLKPGLDEGEILLYFPERQECRSVPRQERLVLRRSLFALTGSQPPMDLFEQLDAGVVTLPARPESSRVHRICICPDNNAPEGSTGCSAQVKDAGSAIATITFDAVDADGDPLTAQFSHRQGAEPVQVGLPSPLRSTCSGGAGSLQCRIAGPAPAQSGDFELMVDVSDQVTTLTLSAQLLVVPVVGEPVFMDRYEIPTCP